MATVVTWARRWGRFVLRLVAVATVSAACGGSTPSLDSPSSAPSASAVVPSAGPSQRADLVVGGDRPVTVHVPDSYDANLPAPLLLFLHGYTGSGEGEADYWKIGPAADARGFVGAYPDGTLDSQGNRFWNASSSCDFEGSGVDDVGYLTGVIAEIEAELSIDPKRIYVFGYSCGGFMAYRLACEAADTVAAIASLAGATYADPADCAPSELVSVAEIHGTADEIVLYGGGDLSDWDPSGSPRPYPGAVTTAETWAAYDGCDDASTPAEANVDVDVGLAGATGPAETTVSEWKGCGSGAAVQLWTVPGGGHDPSVSASFADTVLDFMLDHPKP